MKKPDGTKKPSDNKPAQDAKNDPRGNQANRFGRFEKKPEFSRQKEQKSRDQKKPQPQQEKPAFTIGGKAEKPEKSGSVIVSSGDSRVGKTRTVDTRANDVDLSKYDEKLESFVAADGQRQEKQLCSGKTEAQEAEQQSEPAHPFRGKNDREKRAADKIKQMELEKARQAAACPSPSQTK